MLEKCLEWGSTIDCRKSEVERIFARSSHLARFKTHNVQAIAACGTRDQGGATRARAKYFAEQLCAASYIYDTKSKP